MSNNYNDPLTVGTVSELIIGERARIYHGITVVYGMADGEPILGTMQKQADYIVISSEDNGRMLKKIPVRNRSPEEIRETIERENEKELKRL
jgi:hypothetical protein